MLNKKYCLKPEAKRKLIVATTVPFGFVTVIIMCMGFVWFSVWILLGIPPHNPRNFDFFLALLGIIPWTAMLSGAVILLKRWLIENIVEC